MKLIWKEIIWNPMFNIYVERWYVHPALAITSCVVALLSSFLLCRWIFE